VKAWPLPPLAIGVGLLLASIPGLAADVSTITHGREVDLEDHLVPGKFVLFDFYADWCGPCRSLEPKLLDLAGRHDDRLALRKVDIINWDSAVARQYRLSSIPYLVLYGPDGNRLAAGDAGSVLHRLQSSLGDGGTFVPSASGGSSIIPLVAVSTIFVIAAALVIRRRRPTTPPSPVGSGIADLRPVDTASEPGDPAIWFAMLQGSLEGPFTRAQLGELARRGTVDHSATIRRRGDATWRALDEVLD
jgi:thiol-disulfide isomerase/thioredoxin